LADEGVSVSKSVDNPWNTFIEATGEVFSGNVGNVFKRTSNNDLLYNGHLKAFRDITKTRTSKSARATRPANSRAHATPSAASTSRIAGSRWSGACTAGSSPASKD